MMGFQNYCIICLSQDNLESILSTSMSSTVIYFDMLKFCCDKYENLLHNYTPQKLCSKCAENLEISYNFLKKCEESYIRITSSKLLHDGSYDSRIPATDNICRSEIKKEEIESSVVSREFRSVDNHGDTEEVCRSEIKNHLEIGSPVDEECESVENYDEENNVEVQVDLKEKCTKVDRRKKTNKVRKKVEAFCEICKKTVKDIIQHDKRIHRERPTLQCDKCPASFVKSYSLTLHMRQHDNDLPYACHHPGCQRAFAIPSLLKQHLTTHSDEKRFVCQYCSHAAKTKQQIIIHISYHHTKEKNFVCAFCSKAFVSYQARYDHEKRHKNIKNHACQFCDKKFVSAGNLSNHRQIHSGVKKFICRICGKGFGRKAHRTKHETNVHGVANMEETEQHKRNGESRKEGDLEGAQATR